MISFLWSSPVRRRTIPNSVWEGLMQHRMPFHWWAWFPYRWNLEMHLRNKFFCSRVKMVPKSTFPWFHWWLLQETTLSNDCFLSNVLRQYFVNLSVARFKNTSMPQLSVVYRRTHCAGYIKSTRCIERSLVYPKDLRIWRMYSWYSDTLWFWQKPSDYGITSSVEKEVVAFVLWYY